MKILTKLFNQDKVVDNAISGVDKIFYTKEEKADYFLKLLAAYEPFKIAQRLIALPVTFMFLLVHFISVVLFIISFWYESFAEHAATLSKMNNEQLGMPFLVILGFYFAGGTISSFVNPTSKKR